MATQAQPAYRAWCEGRWASLSAAVDKHTPTHRMLASLELTHACPQPHKEPTNVRQLPALLNMKVHAAQDDVSWQIPTPNRAPPSPHNATDTHLHRYPCHTLINIWHKHPLPASPSAADDDLGDIGGVTPTAGVASGRLSLLHMLMARSGSQVRCWYSMFLADRMSSLAPCRHTTPPAPVEQ